MKSPKIGAKNELISVNLSKNKTTPITIMIPPPIFMKVPLYFFSHVNLVIKKAIKKKGILKPNIYDNIYHRPCDGFAPTSANVADNIGPIQGVQPSAKDKPINIVPK